MSSPESDAERDVTETYRLIRRGLDAAGIAHIGDDENFTASVNDWNVPVWVCAYQQHLEIYAPSREATSADGRLVSVMNTSAPWCPRYRVAENTQNTELVYVFHRLSLNSVEDPDIRTFGQLLRSAIVEVVACAVDYQEDVAKFAS